jgi:hypothetical protein
LRPRCPRGGRDPGCGVADDRRSLAASVHTGSNSHIPIHRKRDRRCSHGVRFDLHKARAISGSHPRRRVYFWWREKERLIPHHIRAKTTHAYATVSHVDCFRLVGDWPQSAYTVAVLYTAIGERALSRSDMRNGSGWTSNTPNAVEILMRRTVETAVYRPLRREQRHSTGAHHGDPLVVP